MSTICAKCIFLANNISNNKKFYVENAFKRKIYSVRYDGIPSYIC